MNIALSFIISALLTFGGMFYQHTHPVIWDAPHISLGTASYPASLDTTSTLPNPGATDSVATVSHSALHTNENGAIEGVEAKVGIGASTATDGTILSGNGTGSSAWSSSLFVTSSSTLQNFTFVNATGTRATTTSFFTTTASSSNLFGGGLQTCGAGSQLVWTSGVFSCTGISTSGSGISTFSTTTLGNMATMTIPIANVPNGDSLRIKVYSPNTVGSNGTATGTAAVVVGFNQFQDAAQTLLSSVRTENDLGAITKSEIAEYQINQITTTHNIAVANASGIRPIKQVTLNIVNSTSTPKWGDFTGMAYGTTTTTGSAFSGTVRGNFEWASTTTRVKSIDIWYSKSGVFFGTSTVITVEGY